MIIKSIFLIMIGVICIFILVGLLLSYQYIRPKRIISDVTPGFYGLKYENVKFQTEDGVIIAGWYIKSIKPSSNAIICCHGYPMDKGNILDMVRFLAENYNLLLFDFRGLGESGGKITTIGCLETKDLKGAVKYLQRRGIKKIGAFGFSLGGVVILNANLKQIQAAVVDSPFRDLDSVMKIAFGNFGFLKNIIIAVARGFCKYAIGVNTADVSPMKSVRNIKFPVLLIHGRNDTQIPFEHSINIYEKGIKDKRDVELWLVPEADHGGAYYLLTEKYMKKVKDFFNEYI